MELLTLVLAEDEPIILKGLLETYDWAGMGYRVVGTARDGEEALQLIQEKKPDLVLTDIQMKKMSGLALIEKSKELGLTTEFVVISAYRDFEFAKKACKNGALSYMVKPIDEEELENNMKQIYENCTATKLKEKNYDLWERILIEDRNNFLNQMIGKYLEDRLTEAELRDFFQSLSMEDRLEHYFAVIAADIDLTQRIVNQKEYDMKQYLLDSELYKCLKEKYPVWIKKSSEGVPCYLLDLGTENHVEPLRQILTRFRKQMSTDLISVISNGEQRIEGLKRGYHQALQLFEVACEAGAGVLMMDQTAKMTVKEQYSIEIESQILGAIRKNEEAQLKEAYKRFIYILPDEEQMARVYLRRLAVRVEYVIQDSYGMTEEGVQGFRNFYQMSDSIMPVKLINVLYQLFLALINQRKSVFGKPSDEYFIEYIHQAVTYIEEHIQEESLSITSVSESVFLNSVYFGRVFKNMMGISFKKYVQNVRMEKAKELILEGKESIASICAQVGMPNPSYFSQVFKQCTGVLPSEYRRNKLNEE